jgi:hypothetical protein
MEKNNNLRLDQQYAIELQCDLREKHKENYESKRVRNTKYQHDKNEITEK